MGTGIVHTLVRLQINGRGHPHISTAMKKVIASIFKATMIAQFVTPSESRLREKLFSRNAEQVRSPYLSSLLL